MFSFTIIINDVEMLWSIIIVHIYVCVVSRSHMCSLSFTVVHICVVSLTLKENNVRLISVNFLRHNELSFVQVWDVLYSVLFSLKQH